jgi:anti-sigma B factor antagonist
VADREPGLRASRPGALYRRPGRAGRRGPASGPVLTIGVRREAGHVLVIVAGELDIATVPRLREQLSALAASGRPLIADLDRVSFIDAAGLGALAGAAGRAAAHGGSLHVVCARDLTRRLFCLTGLDRPAGLAGTVAGALHILAAGPDTPAGGKPRTGEPRAEPGPLVPAPRAVASAEPEAV